MGWYSEVSRDVSKIPDAVAHFESELVNARVEVKLKGNGFKFSKNMCLMFMAAFLSQTPDVRNKIATEVVRYAASNTDISSFFIKVS